jgi:hypothetical protein
MNSALLFALGVCASAVAIQIASGQEKSGGTAADEKAIAAALATYEETWNHAGIIGVILGKVWGGSRTWAGARAQSLLMSVWRTCRQQGRSALDFLSEFLRGTPVTLALPPEPPRANPCTRKTLVLSSSR